MVQNKFKFNFIKLGKLIFVKYFFFFNSKVTIPKNDIKASILYVYFIIFINIIGFAF